MKKLNNNYYLKISSYCFGDKYEVIGDSQKTFIKEEVFLKRFTNFGRLDSISKSLCISTAIALNKIGLYPKETKIDIPIYFSSNSGSLHADINYFKDFLSFNETAGRANLFLYTLPTSPTGEMSVHFGLTGPITYLTSLIPLKSISESIQYSKDAPEYIIVALGEIKKETNSLLMVFAKEEKTNNKLNIKDLATIEKDNLSQIKKYLLEFI